MGTPLRSRALPPASGSQQRRRQCNGVGGRCARRNHPRLHSLAAHGGPAGVEDVGIAIVGGGVGGLTLARVLQCGGASAVVFEREPSLASRGQGGSLDLHRESGQWALEQAGLGAEFRAVARPQGQDMRVMNSAGRVLWDEVSPPGLMDRPEVDRGELLALLAGALRPGVVRWGRQLVSAEREPPDVSGSSSSSSGSPRHVLRFSDGSSVSCRVLVGADGARSLVRPLVTDARPAYSGVSFVEGSIPDAARRRPDLAAAVGRGSLMVPGDGKGVFAQVCGDGHVRVYVALRVPHAAEGGLASLGFEFDRGAAADTLATLLKQFAGWSPAVTNLLRGCEGAWLPRSVYAMPVGLTWPTRPGVTLLGDAAHQMSPFAGAGANMAMQDGAELALELLKAPGDPDAAVAAYEACMFGRAAGEAQESADGLEMCMAPDGAERLAQLMQVFSAHGQQE